MASKAAVYVTARGPDRWQLRAYLGVKSDGRPRFRHETVRGTESEARARAREIEAAMLRGDLGDARSDALGAILAGYIRAREAGGDIEPSTARGYRQALARVPERLARRACAKVRARDLEAFYLDLIEGGLSASTVRATHRFLSVALNAAERLGDIPRAPTRDAKPPSGARRRSALSDEWDDDDEGGAGRISIIERRTALRLIESFGSPTGLQRRNPSLRALFGLAYATGMRRGELCALTWRAIDLDAAEVKVRRALWWPYGVAEPTVKPPKTAAGARTVAISPATVALLREWRAELEALARAAHTKVPALAFPDLKTFGPHRPDYVSNAFRTRMIALEGTGSLNIHALRHSHASELLAAGEPVHLVSARLGHADVATTLRVYAHVIPGSAQGVASRLDSILGLEWGRPDNPSQSVSR